MDDTPEYLNAGQEGCAKCSYKKRINNLNELKKGDHICIDGQNVGSYCFCIRKSLYKHHAIVENVEESNQRVHVIEYGQSADQMKVRKYDYYLDLRMKIPRVWVVRYRSKTFEPKEIYRRADNKLEEADYSLPTNNCEHFCNDCCVGQKESLQVNTTCACLKRSAFLGLDLIKLIRFVSFVVIWSSDDLLQAFQMAPYSFVMLGVLLLVYFLYTVLKCCGYKVFVCKPAWKCCCERIKCAICFSFAWKAACVEFIVYCFCQVGFFVCLLALVKMNIIRIIEVAFGIACSVITLSILVLTRRLMKHWLLPVMIKQREPGSSNIVETPDVMSRKYVIGGEPDTKLENKHTDDDEETET